MKVGGAGILVKSTFFNILKLNPLKKKHSSDATNTHVHFMFYNVSKKDFSAKPKTQNLQPLPPPQYQLVIVYSNVI